MSIGNWIGLAILITFLIYFPFKLKDWLKDDEEE